MQKRLLIMAVIAFPVIVLFNSCNNESTTKEDILADIIPDNQDESIILNKPVDSLRTIFYDLTSPVELAGFVSESGTSYDKELLNSIDNKSKYSINLKQALNLGVYGTDVIYCRMFDQNQDAINYLAAISKITKEIGIPEDIVSSTLGRADKNIENKDSIMNIVQEAYLSSDEYLNDNDRKSSAALVYFGAWTEALYFATTLYNKEESNKERIAFHIASQKFSLNNLQVLLRNSYDNVDIYHYLVMINKLKAVYNDIDVIIEDTDTKIDTVQKTITLDKCKSSISEAQIKEISKIITRVRKDIVS